MNLRTLLVLGRVSNLPTVWSNLLAGWMISSVSFRLIPLTLLLLGGSLLYIGGMYLNDFCDGEFDAQYCPRRPIPSGKISRKATGILALVWFATGLTCLGLLGLLPFGIGLGLVAAIITYDILHKDFLFFAPLIMGFCRFLLYPLAASVAKGDVSPYLIQSAATLGLYVAGITYFARGESRAGKPSHWAILLLVLPVAVSAFDCFKDTGWVVILLQPLLTFAITLLAWQGWLLIPFWLGKYRSIGRIVSGLLAAIVLVDALLMVYLVWDGVCLLPLFLLALVLQRFVPAT